MSRTCIRVMHVIFYTIKHCYGKRPKVFAAAIATFDSIKYQKLAYGSFVWEIHLRFNNIYYVTFPLITFGFQHSILFLCLPMGILLSAADLCKQFGILLSAADLCKQFGILLSAADLCKQFGPRSGPTKCQSSSGPKLFDTLKVILKEFVEKVSFEKSQQATKIMQIYPTCKELCLPLVCIANFKQSIT